MKALVITLFSLILLSCNNSNPKTPGKDSTVVPFTPVDSLKPAAADTAKEEYCYITGIEKIKDSIFVKADYVQYFTGPTVLAEAKKRHRADTVFDKNRKVKDIFVPDDYFIVNDDKMIRSLYLPATTPIKMESEFVTDKKLEINNYGYFSEHYKNSLFMLTVKNKKIEAIKEIFLP